MDAAGVVEQASTEPRPDSDAASAGEATAVKPTVPAPTLAEWSALLPALEAELAAELKTFRKSMKAARILPDFRNRDVFPPSKSGAWAIYHDERELPGGEIRCFTLYVRRTSDQLAVNEDGGHPYGISANFSTAFPWALPTADAIRVALADRLRALGVRPQ